MASCPGEMQPFFRIRVPPQVQPRPVCTSDHSPALSISHLLEKVMQKHWLSPSFCLSLSPDVSGGYSTSLLLGTTVWWELYYLVRILVSRWSGILKLDYHAKNWAHKYQAKTFVRLDVFSAASAIQIISHSFICVYTTDKCTHRIAHFLELYTYNCGTHWDFSLRLSQ